MHRHAGRDLAVAGMEGDALAIDMADHGRDVLDRKRMPQHAVAHAAPGRVAHLAFLQMKPRVGEAIEIAGVVVMQMGDDDVLMLSAETPNFASASTGLSVSLRERAFASSALKPVSTRMSRPSPADQPDEIIEVLRRGLVRIGDQEIHMRGARRHRRIAQRVDFVGISHRCHFSFLDVEIWPMAAPSHCHPQRSNPRNDGTAWQGGRTM